jgi:STE24 endopeptidase
LWEYVVSRILLLMVIVLWMLRSVAPSLHTPLDITHGTILFMAGLLLVVLFMGLWSRVIARNLRGSNLHRSLRRFHQSLMFARLLIPVWFGIAVFALGWGDLVMNMLGPLKRWPVELPGMLIGTAPALLAWMALWWAQFPADRALREHTLLIQFDQDIPVHPPPHFWGYFTANLRLQVLFTVVPVAAILLLRDISAVILTQLTGVNLRAMNSGESPWELASMLLAIVFVVLFMPELLRHVLSTQPLPDSPLRRRLEDLCRRTGLRYRDILLWKTNYNMGNAAVMGIIPQVRYILLSDMLLETMTDKQIEAVFAHELGHVKHRHMTWYVVLFATMMLAMAGPGQLVLNQFSDPRRPLWISRDFLYAVVTLLGIAAFLLVFGFLSRWFERQADVFAARIMEQEEGGSVLGLALQGSPSYVGKYGATTFASALQRVAAVNNIPVSARNFTHGSIAERVRYVQTLSSDPTRTLQFDRCMGIINAAMGFALLVAGVWVLVGLVA